MAKQRGNASGPQLDASTREVVDRVLRGEDVRLRVRPQFRRSELWVRPIAAICITGTLHQVANTQIEWCWFAGVWLALEAFRQFYFARAVVVLNPQGISIRHFRRSFIAWADVREIQGWLMDDSLPNDAGLQLSIGYLWVFSHTDTGPSMDFGFEFPQTASHASCRLLKPTPCLPMRVSDHPS